MDWTMIIMLVWKPDSPSRQIGLRECLTTAEAGLCSWIDIYQN